MKRKLICTFMAVFMSLASTSVFAVKRPAETNNTLNVLESFGSFNSEEALGPIITRNASATWVKDGAPEGSGGAMKVEISDIYGYACVDVPNIIGETLDISFYAKVAAGTASFSVPMRFESQTYGKTQLSGQLSANWKKYSFTYYCDGMNTDGKTTQEPLRLFCLRGDDLVGNAYFLDELTVTPHGDVEYNWANANLERETASRDVIPADDGFAAEQPVNSVTFSDTSGHWSEQTVNILASSGIVSGMGDGNFQPDGSVTRAQFVTMLAGLAKADVSKYPATSFRDVPEGAWYAPYVNWALANGIVSGTSAVTFSPDASITRQDMAVMLYSYTQRFQVHLQQQQPVKPFTDAGSIAAYAQIAVQTLQRAGVISGMPDGSFQPLGTATREQACVVLCTL